MRSSSRSRWKACCANGANWPPGCATRPRTSRTADTLERAATDWQTSGRDESWLLGGTRLADAETLAAKPRFRDRLDPTRDYLLASRTRENDRIAALRKRSRILVALLAVTAIVAVVAVALGVQANHARQQADARFREATSLRLVAEAQPMLAGTRPGGAVRAYQQLLAARRLAQTPDDGPLVNALVKTVNLIKVADAGSSVTSVAFSPDGTRIASGSDDNTVRLWDAATGKPIGAPAHRPHRRGVQCGVQPRRHPHRLRQRRQDGAAVGCGHRTTDRRPAHRPHRRGDRAWRSAPTGTGIASGSYDDTVRLWDAATGQPVGAPLTGHTGAVYSVAFSPDGTRIASGSDDNTVRLWDAATGQPVGAPLTGHTDAV